MNKTIKLYTEYSDRNESSIKFRYLQVRLENYAREIMYYLYPEYSKAFDEYEDSIIEIGKNIYASYIDRFIKKQYVTVPVEEFNVIKECHSWHIEDRLENRISLNKVMEVLNRQTPTNLNRMIRHLKLEKKNNSGDVTTKVQKEFVRKPFNKNGGDMLNKDTTGFPKYQQERRIPLLKR